MEARVTQACEDKQARIRERALALALPDAVFTILYYNVHNRQMGPDPSCDPIPLTVLEQAFNPLDVEIWGTRASELIRDAYAVGDAWSRNDGAYDRLRAEYEAKHRGFSSETYNDAVGYGMWQAR